ncbi:MAG: hypothetical protein JXR90_15425 [Spirochaetes bacterium]|nr:hypothetical protein [Spirochaetota bacterium]
MDSSEFAQINIKFRKKIKNFIEEFEDALNDNNLEVLPDFIKRTEPIIKEYYATAEDLIQYGAGIKKAQFLETFEDDVEYLGEQIEEAEEKLKKTK